MAGGGIATSDAVRRGFADTRASVMRLNHLVVSALLAAGVPAVGLSPCGAWTTRARKVAADGCSAVADLLAAGLDPVLHGDAVLDEELGCTILSGDLIVSRLCERFRPPVVAFLVGAHAAVGVQHAWLQARLQSRYRQAGSSVSRPFATSGHVLPHAPWGMCPTSMNPTCLADRAFVCAPADQRRRHFRPAA